MWPVIRLLVSRDQRLRLCAAVVARTGSVRLIVVAILAGLVSAIFAYYKSSRLTG